MPGKTELVEILDISAEVVSTELALLEEWGNDPDTTTDRRAEIRLAANYIGVGFSSALRRTGQALNQARSLPEAAVAHPPGDAHGTMVRSTVASVSERSEWDGPNLSDTAFTNAMTLAKNNSDQCADNSETILADCTHPDADPPPALVAVPMGLTPRLAKLGKALTAKKKSPSKRSKKSDGAST